MITANITYYNEPHLLGWWYDTIVRLNDEGVSIDLTITDDGSLRSPAENFFYKRKKPSFIRLYRVKKDIGFNSHGCRNLMMKVTNTPWNLLSDIDRHYDDFTLTDLAANTGMKRGEHYSFYGTKSHVSTLNEYAIHKDDFWLSGGYDEEFVNIHWGDRIFFETSLYPVCPRVVRTDWFCEYTRGARNVSTGNVDTTQYPDDNTLINPQNSVWNTSKGREELKEFVRARNKDPLKRVNKPIIQFEWERVF